MERSGINLVNADRKQGLTTIAFALAAQAHKADPDAEILIRTYDYERARVQAGLPSNYEYPPSKWNIYGSISMVPKRESLHKSPETPDFIIQDSGLLIDAMEISSLLPNFLVMRADYCVLQRIVSDDLLAEQVKQFDGLVLVTEVGRALTAKDLTTSLGLEDRPVIMVPVDPAIARANDAGVLLHKAPKVIEKPCKELLALCERKAAQA